MCTTHGTEQKLCKALDTQDTKQDLQGQSRRPRLAGPEVRTCVRRTEGGYVGEGGAGGGGGARNKRVQCRITLMFELKEKSIEVNS